MELKKIDWLKRLKQRKEDLLEESKEIEVMMKALIKVAPKKESKEIDYKKLLERKV